MLDIAQIIETAKRIGFDDCGVAKVRLLEQDKEYLLWWLEQGLDGGLGDSYLGRNIDKRFSPTLLVESAKSVIVCVVNYRNRFSLGYPTDFKGKKIASYSLSEDYHHTIKEKLHRFAQELGVTNYNATVDTAPVAEKRWAVEAGLGRIGRNKLLITPKYGTFVLLGTLVITEKIEQYSTTLEGNPCGECHRCWEKCPTGALSEAGIDAGRCISRLTIEKDADPNADTHGWMFGCEECQSCCPHNLRFATKNIAPTLVPIFDPTTISPEELAHIIPRTAMKRKVNYGSLKNNR